MDHDLTPRVHTDHKIVELVEFSIVLVLNQNDPSILNPDFLQQRKIVATQLQVREQPISTPVFSQVLFNGGVGVKADPERIIFEQKGTSLNATDILCPAMAKRFVTLFPNNIYKAIGVNPKGFLPLPQSVSRRNIVSRLLNDTGKRLSFKDTIPEIQLKAVYHFEGKKIVLDVVGAKRKEGNVARTPGIFFQANFHRDLSVSSSITREERLVSVLSSWERDLSDFMTLSRKLPFPRFLS
jgi:hypothetical protein